MRAATGSVGQAIILYEAALGVGIALGGGFIVYGGLKAAVGLRLDAEEEFNGADLSIHNISSGAERETLW